MSARQTHLAPQQCEQTVQSGRCLMQRMHDPVDQLQAPSQVAAATKAVASAASLLMQLNAQMRSSCTHYVQRSNVIVSSLSAPINIPAHHRMTCAQATRAGRIMRTEEALSSDVRDHAIVMHSHSLIPSLQPWKRADARAMRVVPVTRVS